MRPFTYQKPESPVNAVRTIAAAADTRFLAGGTTLYDLMKLDVEAPSHIVDISSLRACRPSIPPVRAERSPGALARMSDVAADPRLIRDYPALSESLWRAASQQLRNMASLGGGNLLQRTRCAYFQEAVSHSPATSASPAAAAPPPGRHQLRPRSVGRERILHCRLSGRFCGRAGRLRCQGGCSWSGRPENDRAGKPASRAWKHASYRNRAAARRIGPANPRADNAARPRVNLSQDQGSGILCLRSRLGGGRVADGW